MKSLNLSDSLEERRAQLEHDAKAHKNESLSQVLGVCAMAAIAGYAIFLVARDNLRAFGLIPTPPARMEGR